MTIRATAQGLLPGGERWANVFHFRGDTLSEPDAAAIAGRIRDFYDDLKPELVNEWSLQEVTVGLVGDVTTIYAPFIEAVVGSNSATALPNDMAIVVSWRTPFRGRSYRGRTYLCGFNTGAIDQPSGQPAFVVNALLNVIANAADAFLSASAGPNDLVVHSRIPTVGDSSIVGGYVNGTFDTQRRRESALQPPRVTFSL